MRLLGLDPGLRATGWGVVECEGGRLSHVACGTIRPDPRRPLSERLAELHAALAEVVAAWRPDTAAVEETFVNRNPASALKLGMARGVVLLAPARVGIAVAEYHNKQVKKAVVGAARASKDQVGLMVRHLLPGSRPDSADAADALAVAICHAHHAGTAARWAAATGSGA
jgi:crossover junction endodeoxyribonuclease RuvC